MKIARPRLLALSAVCLFVMTSAVDGGEPLLRMRVSPLVSVAPGYVSISVSYEPAAENRRLQVTAESGDFYRSSEVQIEGAKGAPLGTFEFRNLPAGTYQLTGVLVGASGPRATAWGMARVQP